MDQITRALKKELKRAKEEHKTKMDNLELGDDGKDCSLNDF